MSAAMKVVAGARFLSRDFLRFPCYSTATSTLQNAPEVLPTEDVTYPPIKAKYPPGQWTDELPAHQAWMWHKEGQTLLDKEDVRERLESLAGEKPRTLHRVENWDHMPRTLEYKQFVTRTHIVKGLPDVYSTINVDNVYNTLKPIVEDHLVHFDSKYHQTCKETHVVAPLCKHISLSNNFWGSVLHTFLSSCAVSNNHLLHAQIGRDVRLETFWRARVDNGYADPEEDDDKTWRRIWLQYKDKSTYQIRTEQPLPEFLPLDHKLCEEGDYPEIDYLPKRLGLVNTKARPISVSGHWVGDPCEFTHLNMLQLGLPYYSFAGTYKDKPELINEAIIQAGLTSSFGTCVAQAHNQGFNVYFDTTYPFMTQTVVTDGSFVQAFAYQLNTLHMWQPRDTNPKNNILWVGERLKLFDKIENGKVHGFNDEAFIHLLKALLIKPVDSPQDRRPYLSGSSAPVHKHLYINQKGEAPLEHPKIGRWQYPRHPVYF